MNIKSLVASSILLLNAFSASAADSVSFTISAFDTMKYSVTKIEAHPGQKVTVELKNEGTLPKAAMGHNWVLLKAGVDPLAYANKAMTAPNEGYEPKALASQVIASIPQLGPHESAKVTFTAPAAGTYNFICSFPAHFMANMRGVLVVK
jgi:azurin